MLYEFQIHYGGFIVDDGSGKIYKNGVVAECAHVDPDHMSFFEMQ